MTLDIFRSVRFAHSHVISRLSDTSLDAFYYTLKTDAYDHSVWNDVTVSKAVQAVPSHLERQPLFLSIDDTMVEKSGKHFELCSKLYDHAAHNGSNYLNGHCMVSLLLSFPVYQDGKILYLSVPVGYRLWDKEKSKLALAAELVTQAMKVIGPERQVILLCDNWYPKDYEGKTFWSLEEYRIRSKEGIERLVNLISLSYSAMTLLLYSDETFSGFQSASAQETRYEIGQQIQSNIILCSFGRVLETIKNCSALIKVVEDYILSGFRKFQKL